MNLKMHLTALVAAAILSSNACAADNVEAALENTLRRLYPSTQFSGVRQTGIAGIYEVDMGKNIGYTNSEGRYFLFGHLFDMKTQQDLTAQRLET